MISIEFAGHGPFYDFYEDGLSLFSLFALNAYSLNQFITFCNHFPITSLWLLFTRIFFYLFFLCALPGLNLAKFSSEKF